MLLAGFPYQFDDLVLLSADLVSDGSIQPRLGVPRSLFVGQAAAHASVQSGHVP